MHQLWCEHIIEKICSNLQGFRGVITVMGLLSPKHTMQMFQKPNWWKVQLSRLKGDQSNWSWFINL